MSRAAVVLGQRVGPFDGRVDAPWLARFAAATTSGLDEIVDQSAVPPVALAARLWTAQNEARLALIPRPFEASAKSGVHGEHQVLLHRRIEPGEPLLTWVEGHGARRVGHNAAVVLRYGTFDGAGTLVAEQWWSTVFLGVECDATGITAPDHAFTAPARASPAARWSTEVDHAMARRYADVSGDWSPHHFDQEAARRSGSDRPFLHGLCALALCARGVADLIADGDAGRLRRIAVRFSNPLPLGERLDLALYEDPSDGYAFEADCAGAAVIRHGRAELF